MRLLRQGAAATDAAADTAGDTVAALQPIPVIVGVQHPVMILLRHVLTAGVSARAEDLLYAARKH